MSTQNEPKTVWQPLREPLFRAMWTAALVSNIGTWMQNVGAAWLMTSLTSSALLVALVQTATALPVVLVSLPAGAIGDIVDRRALLLATQAWMFLTAAVLGISTRLGATTPIVLLLLTFGLGFGSAFMNPTWQAIQPELVSREELPDAVSLGAVGFNLSRAIGPVLGGIVLTLVGPAAVFLVNAISFIAVFIVVYRWRREPPTSSLPPETLSESISHGVRYVRNNPELRAVLARTTVFITFASSIWALLPLLVRNQLGLGANGYGLIFGMTGLGAALGITVLERARKVATPNQIVVGASGVFAVVVGILGSVPDVAVVVAAAAVSGVAWIAVLSTLNTSVQLLSPMWVRARTLSVYMLCFLGGMALGGFIWGTVADFVGTSTALVVAAGGLLIGLFATRQWKIPETADVDVRPSAYWSDPTLVFEVEPEAGPVLVTLEYRIEPKTEAEFLDALQRLELVRRRNGARYWGVFRDTTDPDKYVEMYVTGTWTSHLREHEHVSVADRGVQERVNEFHVGDDPPVVTHFISPRR